MIKDIIIALGIAYSYYQVRLVRAKAISQELKNQKLKRKLEDK